MKKNTRYKSIYPLLSFLWVVLYLTTSSCQQKKILPPENTPSTLFRDTAKLLNIKTTDEINKTKVITADGELITRSDDDFESLVLMNFSKRDKSYSHAGIIFKEDSNTYVYHSMTGIENPEGCCRRDLYDSFVNPVKKTGFGLFKYNLSPKEINLLHAYYKKQYAAKTPFDIFFNLKSNDSLYCSELIYKGLLLATNGRVKLPISTINNFKPKIMGYRYNNAFFKKFDFIGIDDLYLNPFCKEIKRVKY